MEGMCCVKLGIWFWSSNNVSVKVFNRRSVEWKCQHLAGKIGRLNELFQSTLLKLINTKTVLTYKCDIPIYIIFGGILMSNQKEPEPISRENRSKPPTSMPGFDFLRSGFGPERPIFSRCWCWDRTANRFTCTGMGTTILLADPDPEFLPSPCEVKPAFTLFHFALRFWNHIFT